MDSELARITTLCREAAKLGPDVGMSDARPAAVIRTPAEPPLSTDCRPSRRRPAITYPADMGDYIW
ncbi:MAG TPA: hypothetical protein VE198_04075 [Actinoallomurus sp.]|jgi:hypothetical protein|nr:hypothetical protein [Actinoallomurus sp.]